MVSFSQKLGTLVLGWQFRSHWSHHRVSLWGVNRRPSSELFHVKCHLVCDLVSCGRLPISKPVACRWLVDVLHILADPQVIGLVREDLFNCQVFERRRLSVQGLGQRSLLHWFVLFQSLGNPGCGRRHTCQRWLIQPGHTVRHLAVAKSSSEALEALLDLAGLSLNDPLEDVTAWWKIWSRADENFRREPSSPSPSEEVLSLEVNRRPIPGRRFRGWWCS